MISTPEPTSPDPTTPDPTRPEPTTPEPRSVEPTSADHSRTKRVVMIVGVAAASLALLAGTFASGFVVANVADRRPASAVERFAPDGGPRGEHGMRGPGDHQFDHELDHEQGMLRPSERDETQESDPGVPEDGDEG